ncbi:MAG: hypothetical protein LBM69_10040 [Lachnospiraceae bacterium]|nr:hypothetical protein [Lachnospiraceae bacterium]
MEMRPSKNERLLVRSFLLPGLIGTPRESNTPNCPLRCAVRPGYNALNVQRESVNSFDHFPFGIENQNI